MKKFKIKNRPKRKYVRKQVASSFSLSKTATFGLIPSILVAIALVTTVVISSYPAGKAPDFSNINISFPAIYLDGFGKFLTTLFSGIVSSITAFHAPTMPQPQSITFTPPHVDTEPFFRFLSFLQTIWTSISTAFVNFFVTFAAILDPRPAAGLIEHGIVVAGQTVGNVCVTIAQVFIVIVTEFLSGIGYVAIAILNLFTAAFWGMIHLFVVIGQAIAALVVAIANGIIIVVSAITAAVAAFFALLWRVIMTPFVALHHLYLQAKPFLDYIANSVKKSLNAINDGLNGWSAAASFLSQNNPQH